MTSAGEPANRVPERPLLKPWYRLATVRERLVLRYGGSVLEVAGRGAARLLPHLLPLLDGRRTVDEIAAALGEPVRPAVDHALGLLARERLLVDPVGGELPPDVARTVELLAASDRYDRGPAAALRGLERASAVVLGSAPAARLLGSLLRRSGVARVDTAGWEDDAAHAADLAVVAPSGEELGRLEGWNRAALDRGTCWLPVLPFDGLLAAVGPLVVPHESACHECYRLRRAANVSPLPDGGRGSYPAAPALDAALAGLAAVVALRRLALGDGSSVGVLLALEAGSRLACTRHVLYRVPRCPACSPSASLAAPSPWHAEEARAA